MIESGIYFRVKRNGKWQSLLFEQLSHDEQRFVLQSKNHAFLVSLCNTLSDLLNTFNHTIN